MSRSLLRLVSGLTFLGALCGALASPGLVSAQKPEAGAEDLSDFRTVETAITTKISKAAPAAVTQPGYLGVHVAPDKQGRLVVAHLQADSPAAKAGLQE